MKRHFHAEHSTQGESFPWRTVKSGRTGRSSKCSGNSSPKQGYVEVITSNRYDALAGNGRRERA